MLKYRSLVKRMSMNADLVTLYAVVVSANANLAHS